MKAAKYIMPAALAIFLNNKPMAFDSTQAISNILVGEWEWETSTNNCSSLTSAAFRTNGTWTSTTESCDITSDGFGLFAYGWYVANDHICFTYDERQQSDEKRRQSEYRKLFLAQVKEGYVKERCRWKVKRYSRKELEIETDNKTFTMIRSDWL